MKLIVHVGAHKTATTHLQSRLYGARAALLRTDAAYLGTAAARAGPVPLSALVKHPGRWPEVEAAWRDRLDALQASGASRLILSEENLLGTMVPGSMTDSAGTLYPLAGPRLKALFSILHRRPTSVALAVREPSSFVTSAFGMWLLSGNGVTVEDFLMGADVTAMRWSDLARRILGVPGVERLSVWRFEDYPRDRDKVLVRLLGEARAHLVRGRPRALAGWSQAAYDAFLQSVQDAGEGENLVDLAQAARRSHPKTEGVAGMSVLDEATCRASAAAYAEDLKVLERLPGVRMV